MVVMVGSFQTSLPLKEGRTIAFEYNGSTYALTEDEIKAAYRYQERWYRLDDARRQLNILIFGYEGSTRKTTFSRMTSQRSRRSTASPMRRHPRRRCWRSM